MWNMIPLPLLPPAAKQLWHLPENGLAGGAVHEFRAKDGAAHISFAVLLLARLREQKPILWVGPSPAYPPGLAWLGLDPALLVFAQARDDAESLGTLEVGLRGGMAGVAEVLNITRLAARRLALAAKTGGSIGFLLRIAPAFTTTDSTAFATRWMITPLPSVAGAARLKAELLYAKGGRPGVFFYEITEAENATPPALTLVSGIAVGEQRKTG
jgi:protein ImuA